MRYLRPFALALPVALAAACGPLEGDADWVAAEQPEVARVVPDVAEPAPPGEPGDGLATPTPIEDPAVAYMRDLTLPSPAEEEQLAPDEEDEQGSDGEGDGRG